MSAAVDLFMKRAVVYGLLVVALGCNLIAGAKVFRAGKSSGRDNPGPSLDLFAAVLERVRNDYVDGTNLSNRELVYSALKGMVNTLDPHSEFLEPERFKQLQDDTQGAFGGLGIVIALRDKFITVVAPIEDSPGFKAGILTGDRIIKIAGKSAEKMSLDEAVKNLRGEPGTEVAITFFRPSTGATLDLKLERAIINIDMVKDVNSKKEFPLGSAGIGYVRLVQFGEKTGEELETALRKLKRQGMQAMILDLRWNPGGLLDQAVAVCEKFLPRGKLVVTTEGRNPLNNSTHRAMGRGDELVAAAGAPLPLVVLVNLGSASAAEIVAGCLQDSRPNTIVLGEQTFGKGSVQTILPNPDGSALKLTMAKYYTPSHKVIHEHGITPDVFVPMSDEEERDIFLQRTPGGIESLEEKDRERVRNSRDGQLDRATDLLKGMMLYARLQPAEAAPGKLAAAK